jgi:hypothetical protein
MASLETGLMLNQAILVPVLLAGSHNLLGTNPRNSSGCRLYMLSIASLVLLHDSLVFLSNEPSHSAVGNQDML